MSATQYQSIASRGGEDTTLVRARWTDEQIADGIVEQSLGVLVDALDPDLTRPILRRGHTLNIPRPVEFRGCRVDVVGWTNCEQLSEGLHTELADRAREALTICVLPTSALEVVGPSSSPSPDVATGVLVFYPRDIDALVEGEVSFVALVEHKFIRRYQDRPDADAQFAPRQFRSYAQEGAPAAVTRPLEEAIAARGEDRVDWLPHPSLVEVDSLCARGRNVLLIGYSSAGKSVLAFQTGRMRAAAGWEVGYLNLGEGNRLDGVFEAFVLHGADQDETNSDASRLYILDDLQSAPAAARLVLGLASLSHRARVKNATVFLGVSWKEFAKEAAEWCPDVAPVAVHAHVIRQRLIEKYSRSIEDDSAVLALEREIGDDIFLLRLALEITLRERTRPTRGDVAADVWHRRLSDNPVGVSAEARRVALLAAAVGQFDIHVPPTFLLQKAHVTARVLTDLIEARLLRRVGTNVSLGHRSLCALIATWLGETGGWEELRRLGGPGDASEAVLAYLETSGTAAIIETFQALIARGGFRDRAGLSQRAVALMDLWRAFDAVVERVQIQQERDPTWGKTPSSSVFVTTLLGEIGRPQLALSSLAFLRRHWALRDERLVIDVDDLATVVDFSLLRDAIIGEDDERAAPEGAAPGVDLDIDRFHKTWLAGLILGAEATATESVVPRDQLAQAVEALHLPQSGAFYPERVPWCTARVLLGLAACGRSITTSPVVHRATEWLLRSRADGGAASDGMWVSGTGRWNTPLETTALVLLALIKTGVDPADPRLESAREYLLSQRERWAGFEGAATIEALLAIGVSWQDLSEDTARVSAWALDQSHWQRATLPANEILEQTCHIAQAATHLVDIGWTAIKSDLHALLEAIDLPQPSVPTSADLARELGSGDDDGVAEHGPGEAADIAERIIQMDSMELARFCVVGEYSRYDERARYLLRAHYEQIRSAVVETSQLRNNYLIWAPPGSGKSFFVQQIAADLGPEFLSNGYFELNLAALSQQEFTRRLADVRSYPGPTLCMLDEIDGRSSESWPYEELFAMLDLNTVGDRQIVFVLIGSSGKGIRALENTISARSKGEDLIDRIPFDNRFEIPPARDEDRLVVFAKQALVAARGKQQPLSRIERLGVYYVLQRSELSSPRQCSEFAKAAVSRMDAGDDSLRFRFLFHPNDGEQMQFFAENMPVASRLQSLFVDVRD